MRNISFIGEKMVESRYELADQIQQIQNPIYKKEVENRTAKEQEKVDSVRSEFIRHVGESLSLNYENAQQELIRWGENIGKLSVEQRIPLEVAIQAPPLYRKLILQKVKDIADEHDLSPQDAFDAMLKINVLMDQIVEKFILAYDTFNKELLRTAQDNVLSLSVPVVPINDSTAVLPLVGEIDEGRSSCLLEQVTQKSVELQLTTLIIDLSGVATLDNFVANSLYRLINALRLIGVDSVLTGVRAGLAQTLIEMDVDLHNVATYATLKQALKDKV